MHGIARAAGLLLIGGLAWLNAPTRAHAGIFDPVAKPQTPATAATPENKPRDANPPHQPHETNQRVKWDILARSVEGRVIEYAQFGSGPKSVLVVGSLLGSEPEGDAVAESIAEHLERFPRRLEELTVTIVRNPNPDGHQKGTAENARGVRLDRNFRTLGWRKVASGTRFISGEKPESEPETIALVELLVDANPDRVILLSTSKGRNTVQFAGNAEGLARQVVAEGDFRLTALDTTAEWGSLLSVTGLEGGVPTLRLGFVPQATADALFSNQKRALMTAIGCGTQVEFANATPGDALERSQDPYANAADGKNAAPGSHRPASSQKSRPIVVGPPPAGALRFNAIAAGLPVVPVTRPDAAAPPSAVTPFTAPSSTAPPPTVVTNQPSAAPPHAAPIATDAPQVATQSEAFPARIQPLPVTQQVKPLENRPRSAVPLPQAPIRVYPDTGLK